MRREIHDRNILFLCEDDAQLSQMTEAAAKHLSPPKTRIFSAGVKAGRIPPAVIKAMNEIGIPIAGQNSKSLDEVPIDEIAWDDSFWCKCAWHLPLSRLDFHPLKTLAPVGTGA